MADNEENYYLDHRIERVTVNNFVILLFILFGRYSRPMISEFNLLRIKLFPIHRKSDVMASLDQIELWTIVVFVAATVTYAHQVKDPSLCYLQKVFYLAIE